MSTLETNAIGKYSGDNVSVDDALNLKSYDTAGRDALTSVAGDMIYNTTESKVQFHNGSAWQDFSTPSFSVSYLIIAGGGGGGRQYGGGGGAGGYRNSYASETSGRNSSTETPLTIFKDGVTEYLVTVGAGGVAGASGTSGAQGDYPGNDSIFSNIVSNGGGSSVNSRNGGSGAGGAASSIGLTPGLGTAGQGFDGGSGANTNIASAGGGGAGAAGGDNGHPVSVGGSGGDGLSSSITGSAVTRAGGGGGGRNSSTPAPSGGSGGGGNGATNGNSGSAGTVNTGGGGGNGYNSGSGAGGSGVVILRWATGDATIGATRTGLVDGNVQTDGSDSYIVFTGGEGDITFS